MSDKDSGEKQPWLVPIVLAVIGTISAIAVAWINKAQLTPSTTPTPSPIPISGVWQHNTDGVGSAKWTLIPRGGNLYDAQEEGLGNAKGIATLNGNHWKINFSSADETITGSYEWDINSDLNSGVGKLEFFSGDKSIHHSKLIRIK